MKIGILTFSRTHNFGAILQCYALQKTLVNLGYDVEVIEYKQPHIEATNRPFTLSALFKKIMNPKNLYGYIKTIRNRYLSEKRFESFKNMFLTCSTPCTSKSIPQDFNAYIIGSDQVWSLDCTLKPDPVFWGGFKRNSQTRLYSYAISTNLKSLKSIDEYMWKKVSIQFDNLSFREKAVANYVQNKIRKDVNVNIDPTLLIDAEVWYDVIDLDCKSDNYILVYEARKKVGKENALLNSASMLAKRKQCNVVNLTYDYSPQEFVTLFAHANYIITSSFHGCVFGLIFKKPMSVVCLGDGHDDRYVDLLTSVGAESALMSLDDQIHENQIDYVSISTKLNELRKTSIKYLETILE